jgi:hypothetical protein
MVRTFSWRYLPRLMIRRMLAPPPPVPGARDDMQQVWVWRRSVGRLIDLRRLSLGRPNERCGGALAAMDEAMDTRRYTMLRPGTVPFEETSIPR